MNKGLGLPKHKRKRLWEWPAPFLILLASLVMFLPVHLLLVDPKTYVIGITFLICGVLGVLFSIVHGKRNYDNARFVLVPIVEEESNE